MKNKRLAVIDSSPLISLAHLDLCSEIDLFFDLVYVPRAVHEEVNRKGRFRYRLKTLYETEFFAGCFAADAANVRLLRGRADKGKAEALIQSREKHSGVGAGEAEGLIQAQERHAMYFIADDKRAREIGKNFGLRCVGTARLLARLELEGRSGPVRALVEKLRRDLPFRVSDEVVEEAIAMASEPI